MRYVTNPLDDHPWVQTIISPMINRIFYPKKNNEMFLIGMVYIVRDTINHKEICIGTYYISAIVL